MKAQDVIVAAAREFKDPDYVRIEEAAWLGYLHLALLMMAAIRPDIFAISHKVALTEGSTRQSLPEGYISLSRVVCNINEAGDERGRHVTATSMDNLNDALGSWHAADEATEIIHFAKIDTERDAFYVYPPPVAGMHLEIVAAPEPALPSDLDADLERVKEVELPSLIMGTLHWAYRMNIDSTVDKQNSNDCLGQMFLLLGKEKEAEILMGQRDAEDDDAS